MARDITKLHPYMQEKADELVKACAKQGLKIKITDCVRDKAEQNGIDSSRTGAKYPKSYHNWGLAFDFCRTDHKDPYYNKDGLFDKVGKIGQSIGLKWGGVEFLPSLYDGPHFHTIKFGTYKQLIEWYGDPSKYFECWKLKTPVKSVTSVSPKTEIMWVQYKLNEAIVAGLKVDGVIGPATAKAVKQFYDFKNWEYDKKIFTGRVIGTGMIKSLSYY